MNTTHPISIIRWLLPILALALLMSARAAHADWYMEVQQSIEFIHELADIEKKSAKHPRKKRQQLESRCNSPGRKRGERMYRKYILEASRRYGVHPDFIQAVIWQESKFDKHAQSQVGALGLMQLMDGTARDMGVKNRKDPRQNIMGGTRYLRLMLDQFQDVPTALAAYNAGPNKTRRVLNKRDTFKGETLDYVPKVIKEFNRLRRERKQ